MINMQVLIQPCRYWLGTYEFHEHACSDASKSGAFVYVIESVPKCPEAPLSYVESGAESAFRTTLANP